MQKIAIVGSGIAGMGCAHLLALQNEITIFERNDYTGGHTNTIEVISPATGAKVAFDTGFMVFNYITYPTLTKLFAELRVPVQKTDMSFSVQYLPDKIEWNGAGLNKVFSQRINLLRPRFLKMIKQLDWFNKNAPGHLLDNATAELTVAQYVAKFGLGQDFLNWYMVPMGGAVWSTSPENMLNFPIATLIHFFRNHGFLGLDTHFQWYTVEGGSRNYVTRLVAGLSQAIRLNQAVKAVVRRERGAEVVTEEGTYKFDKVILACHADEALEILAQPSNTERELLTPFKYENNSILVHTDETVMPQIQRAWASWNYRVDRHETAAGEAGGYKPTTHYWMNNLQRLSGPDNYFVSLNSEHLVRPEKILRRLKYSHPLFDLGTFKAQPELSRLNEGGDVYFCGSYFGYGFHEDALASAYQLCEKLLRQPVVL